MCAGMNRMCNDVNPSGGKLDTVSSVISVWQENVCQNIDSVGNKLYVPVTKEGMPLLIGSNSRQFYYRRVMIWTNTDTTVINQHLKLTSNNYSLCQKKRTFNLEIFCGPPGGGGPKSHMVDYVNESSIHAQFFSLENLQPFWRYFKRRGSMFRNKNCSFHKIP